MDLREYEKALAAGTAVACVTKARFTYLPKLPEPPHREGR
jgi:hypothetical protein